MAKRAPLTSDDEGVALSCIPHQVVELCRVGHKPSGQSFAFSFAALCKLQPRKPDLILLFECDNDGSTYFEMCKETRLHTNGKQGYQGQALLCEMLSEPSRNNGVSALFKLPLMDLSKTSANVLGDSAVNRDPGHTVG